MHCWWRERSTFCNALFLKFASSSGQVVETACQRTIQPDNIMQFPFLSFYIANKTLFSVIFHYTCFSWWGTMENTTWHRNGTFDLIQCDQLHIAWASIFFSFIITYFMLVRFQGFLRNHSDQQSDDGSLNVRCLLRYLFIAEQLKSNYHINQNPFTVELLIGFAWNAEQTLYLYFLDLIKLHWELYVFITSFPTP